MIGHVTIPTSANTWLKLQDFYADTLYFWYLIVCFVSDGMNVLFGIQVADLGVWKCSCLPDVLQKPVTDGSTISSTTSGLTPERKSPPNSSSALPLPQAEKTKKVRCLIREANISYSIQIINRELINGLSHHSDLRFDISPPVIQSLARLILKLDRGPCFHERNTLSDNNELFLKWIHVIPLTAYHVLIDKLGVIS